MSRSRTQVALWVALATLVGCGTAGVVQTALSGDLPTLRRQLGEQQKSGELDEGTVEDVARAVAGREIRSAKGEAAARRIRGVRSCARPLLPVLRDRANTLDDPGAEAALVLLEQGDLSRESAIEKYGASSSGSWRAVAARATVAAPHAALRRKLFTDPDERVRRAALAAAYDARDAADMEALLEAGRLDPDALSRSEALRAAGAIGGERAVLALVDLWLRSDATTRLTIVEAWTAPASFATGGQKQLVEVAEKTSGLPSISAAGALVRGGSTEQLGVLLRAVANGSREERQLAIGLVPVDSDPGKQAVSKAGKDSDKEVAVAALARLAALPGERKAALAELRKLAAGKDAPQSAMAALAEAGDEAVAPRLQKQLASRVSAERREAAQSLIRLGRYGAAASALADEDPGVRAAVACSVLAQRARPD